MFYGTMRPYIERRKTIEYMTVKEAAQVDDLILSIGKVSLESDEAIVAAEEAYNALLDKDKADVEHYPELKEAKLEERK